MSDERSPSPVAPAWLASPYWNDRPAGCEVDLLVLHAITLPAGLFSTKHIKALFTGTLQYDADPSFASLKGLEVSAHFVVDRSGGVTQFVACDKRAWHAGVSEWQGRPNCNDYAIGIEMVGDEQHPFTAAQYREVARLCRALMLRYPGIHAARIVGHQDVAPGRKWDPGCMWDWPRFRRSLACVRRVEMALR